MKLYYLHRNILNYCDHLENHPLAIAELLRQPSLKLISRVLMEESDPIVSSIPLISSPSLSPYLHILQFPLVASDVDHSSFLKISTAKFKPKAHSLEFFLPLVTKSDNYDKARGTELGLGSLEGSIKLAGSQAVSANSNSKTMLSEIKYSSDNISSKHSSYLVALYKDSIEYFI